MVLLSYVAALFSVWPETALTASHAAAAHRHGGGCRGWDSGFDMMRLELSYAPTWCRRHLGASSDECRPTAHEPYGWILHGLWPQFGDRKRKELGCGYPEFCHTAWRSNDDVIASLDRSYPSWKGLAPEYTTLGLHEWAKHGSCSGLDMDAYFLKALSMAGAVIDTDAEELQSHKKEGSYRVCYDMSDSRVHCPGTP